MMIVIGISGKKKCGKSLMADYIRTIFPDRAHIVSFADALKQEVALAAGVDVKYINDHKDDFRLILQGWGTNFRRRHCGEDYWIKRLYKSCIDISVKSPDAIILIPDVRFRNEAAAILNIKGMLVRINRNECDIDDQHPSEVELDSWTRYDYIINNDGTIEDFKQEINKAIEALKLR